MQPEALLAFLRQHRLAVQASVSPENGPQAAVVGFAVTDRFEIVFDTLDSTRKVRNLRSNRKLALVIGGSTEGEERTAQYEGVADIPEGKELDRLKSAYYAVYPDGPSRLTWRGLVYVRVRPTWIRYSDYTAAPPLVVEFGPEHLLA
ncbi:MAG TPA: pyridoxamine 5'-phosphate oxidase family protein [Vicinamibacterales bacterium]|nr:pyridoxamine 5'-phosphate oxidase family protein [Vicinamibacterales bacterium]